MKFKQSSIEYKQRRAELSDKLGEREIWSVIDHWPLYVGVQTMARTLALSDLLRSTLHTPGHIAEFGCFRGAGLMFLAKIMRIIDSQAAKEIHGFDSFQGLTEFTDKDPHDSPDAVATTGQFQGDLNELRQLIELDDFQDEVDLHVGLIEDTLPQFLQDRPEINFSFVMCDTDLYQSTKLILEQMHPRLVKGGIFVLDEWNADYFPGEGIAVQEFLSEFGDSYEMEHVPATRQPTLVLRKTRL